MIKHYYNNKKIGVTEINESEKYTISNLKPTLTNVNDKVLQDRDLFHQDLFLKDGYLIGNISFYSNWDSTISRGTVLSKLNIGAIDKPMIVTLTWFPIDTSVSGGGSVAGAINNNGEIIALGNIPPSSRIGLNFTMKVVNFITS